MPENISLSRIQQLKDSGMGNTQVIDELEKEGYTSKQIFDVLNQPDVNPVPPVYNPHMSDSAPMLPPQAFDPSADTEEMIEAIIDEKWNDLMGDINKVIAWKEATEAKVVKMEQQITDLKSQMDKLHASIIGKVAEYDKHILDVGAEVKAMEKVFSKVLPVFTDNVAELARITDKVKKKKK